MLTPPICPIAAFWGILFMVSPGMRDCSDSPPKSKFWGNVAHFAVRHPVLHKIQNTNSKASRFSKPAGFFTVRYVPEPPGSW